MQLTGNDGVYRKRIKSSPRAESEPVSLEVGNMDAEDIHVLAECGLATAQDHDEYNHEYEVRDRSDTEGTRVEPLEVSRTSVPSRLPNATDFCLPDMGRTARTF